MFMTPTPLPPTIKSGEAHESRLFKGLSPYMALFALVLKVITAARPLFGAQTIPPLKISGYLDAFYPLATCLNPPFLLIP